MRYFTESIQMALSSDSHWTQFSWKSDPLHPLQLVSLPEALELAVVNLVSNMVI